MDNEGQDDRGTGTDGASDKGASTGGTDNATDDARDGKPNGKPGDDKPGDGGTDWKSRARQHEDAAKAARKERADALADRDKLSKVLDGLRKALDPDGAGKDASPEELAKQAAQQAEQARAEVKLAKVELAAERAARRAGADVDALLDSRQFLTAIADLDPADDKFAEQVDEAVKAAIEARPSLKANAPKPRSGAADMTGGGANGSGQLSRADLKTMTPAAIEKARKDGRLKNLLGG